MNLFKGRPRRDGGIGWMDCKIRIDFRAPLLFFFFNALHNRSWSKSGRRKKEAFASCLLVQSIYFYTPQFLSAFCFFPCSFFSTMFLWCAVPYCVPSFPVVILCLRVVVVEMLVSWFEMSDRLRFCVHTVGKL